MCTLTSGQRASDMKKYLVRFCSGVQFIFIQQCEIKYRYRFQITENVQSLKKSG
jgi:hypothetical protein